jgi:hypothetical protein
MQLIQFGFFQTNKYCLGKNKPAYNQKQVHHKNIGTPGKCFIKHSYVKDLAKNSSAMETGNSTCISLFDFDLIVASAACTLSPVENSGNIALLSPFAIKITSGNSFAPNRKRQNLQHHMRQKLLSHQCIVPNR